LLYYFFVTETETQLNGAKDITRTCVHVKTACKRPLLAAGKTRLTVFPFHFHMIYSVLFVCVYCIFFRRALHFKVLVCEKRGDGYRSFRDCLLHFATFGWTEKVATILMVGFFQVAVSIREFNPDIDRGSQ